MSVKPKAASFFAIFVCWVAVKLKFFICLSFLFGCLAFAVHMGCLGDQKSCFGSQFLDFRSDSMMVSWSDSVFCGDFACLGDKSFRLLPEKPWGGFCFHSWSPREPSLGCVCFFLGVYIIKFLSVYCK